MGWKLLYFNDNSIWSEQKYNIVSFSGLILTLVTQDEMCTIKMLNNLVNKDLTCISQLHDFCPN